MWADLDSNRGAEKNIPGKQVRPNPLGIREEIGPNKGMTTQDGEMAFCNNCQKDIASVNFVVHEIHCLRNILRCGDCGDALPKAEMKDHVEQYHTSVDCPVCGEAVTKSELEHHTADRHTFKRCKHCQMEIHRHDLEQHQSEVCWKRPSTCPYCELELPMSEKLAHVDYCGSRTEPCLLCNKLVMYKELEFHKDTKCAYPFDVRSYRKTDDAADLYEGFEGGQFADVPDYYPDRSPPPYERFDRQWQEPRRTLWNDAQHSYDDYLHEEKFFPIHYDDMEPSLHDFEVSDDTQIPCEFCEKPLPADQLIVHQTGCFARPPDHPPRSGGPDLSSVPRAHQIPYEHQAHRPRHKDHIVAKLETLMRRDDVTESTDDVTESTDDVTESIDDMIPCEFCHSLVVESEVDEHQDVCRRKFEEKRYPRLQSDHPESWTVRDEQDEHDPVEFKRQPSGTKPKTSTFAAAANDNALDNQDRSVFYHRQPGSHVVTSRSQVVTSQRQDVTSSRQEEKKKHQSSKSLYRHPHSTLSLEEREKERGRRGNLDG